MVNDKYNTDRIASLGNFEYGMSEVYPCVTGPMLLIHKLTLEVTGELSNAFISIMPHGKSKMVQVAKCEEGYPTILAASYRAVVNPED